MRFRLRMRPIKNFVIAFVLIGLTVVLVHNFDYTEGTSTIRNEGQSPTNKDVEVRSIRLEMEASDVAETSTDGEENSGEASGNSATLKVLVETMEKQVDPDERARTNAWLIYDNPTAALEKGLSTEEIQTAASYLNDHHVILNEDLFGNISGVQVVIIVQVHSRLRYLRGLIESLRATVGIEKALLVFSHDIVAEPLNDLVRSIRFCRVIQIFYPFSVTFFDDVRSNTDLGNYTHLKSDVYPQMKNHWWWKMNYVFDGVVKRYGLEDRHVLRLEEDNYVAPDVLHVLNQLIEQKQSVCESCGVISVGARIPMKGQPSKSLFEMTNSKFSIAPWFHNLGMTFSLPFWELMKQERCAKIFCEYNDYNWDLTFSYVLKNCVPDKMLDSMYVRATRVFHIGDCGVHVDKCKQEKSIDNVRNLLKSVKDSLFPQMQFADTVRRRFRFPLNGGFNTKEATRLCEKNTHPYVPLS